MRQPTPVGAAKAEKRAEELLSQFGITRPPVPVDEIVTRLGIDCFTESMPPDTSSVLVRQPDGRRVIAVNSTHHRLRKRFSVAHELGHALLHFPEAPQASYAVVDRPLEVLFRDGLASEGSNRVEIDANAFAAALLMPRRAVEQHFREELGRGARISAVTKSLAQTFDVSAQAMGFRLVNLGLLDPA